YDAQAIRGPHLDLNGLLDSHKADVLALRQKKTSADEIATYNLARAFKALFWIKQEVENRFISVGNRELRRITQHASQSGKVLPVPIQTRIASTLELMTSFFQSTEIL